MEVFEIPLSHLLLVIGENSKTAGSPPPPSRPRSRYNLLLQDNRSHECTPSGKIEICISEKTQTRVYGSPSLAQIILTRLFCIVLRVGERLPRRDTWQAPRSPRHAPTNLNLITQTASQYNVDLTKAVSFVRPEVIRHHVN